MELKQVLVKNFTDFINGREVDAIVELKENKIIQPGENVLAFKDSLAATTSLAVPREKQDLSIGVQGTVTEVVPGEPMQKSNHVQRLKIKKV
jgi:hypothetical protein